MPIESDQVETTTALRLRLVRAGYVPLPLYGKAPPTFGKNNRRKGLADWQKLDGVTREQIEMWGKTWPDAVNTGVLTRLMPTLDIDILNEEAARTVEDYVRKRFEDRGRILPRIGKPPKRAIPFKTDTPFAKIVANVVAPNGSAEKIEFLGDGQQVAVFGIHPDTQKPYRWRGGEPGQFAREELPHIREEEAQKLVDDIVTEVLVRDFGYQHARERPRKRREGNGKSFVFEDGSADWQYLRDNIREGRELHDSLRDLAAKLIASGMSAGAVVNDLRGAMTGSTAPHDERWQERFEDIPRLVDSAERLHEADKEEAEAEPQQPQQPLLHAYAPRPFSQIPRRQWLHAGHYIRQQVVMTVAPGGYGKTTLLIANAVEMCTGLGLLGSAPPGGALRVAYWNAEDPEDEVERRIAAACLRHDINPETLRDRLFLGSKITGGRRLASLNRIGSVVFDDGILAEVSKFIADNKIDCAMFDPLVAFHRVPESNNTAMEEVIKQAFEPIAITTNCCVELSQHTRKSAASQQGEIGVDDSRGAGAITNAARSVRVLNRMTAQEAELPKIEPEERRHYLRINRDKTNLAPPGKATWIHLASVELPNGDDHRPGDHVQAAEPWDYPQPFDDVTAADMQWMREAVRSGNYRTSPRSPDWIGLPLIEHLGLDSDDKGDRKKVGAILKTWFANGVLATEEREDKERHKRPFVVPGPWKEEQ
jgi:AAA domain-containing protein/bifunctional DNA primase/polymerase-like protein